MSEPPKEFIDQLLRQGDGDLPDDVSAVWRQGPGYWFRAGQRAQAEKDAEIAEAYKHIPPYSEDVRRVAEYNDATCRLIAAAIRAAAPKEGGQEPEDPWGLKDTPLDSWERE